MKHITTLLVRNMKFEIVHDEKGFWAIEHKYIKELADGKLVLKKQINGLQGNLRETLEDCLETARFEAEVAYIMETKKCDIDTAFEIFLANEK